MIWLVLGLTALVAIPFVASVLRVTGHTWRDAFNITAGAYMATGVVCALVALYSWAGSQVTS